MIAIIAHCGTNVASIQFALQRLGKTSCITDDSDTIANATHVIIPGVSTAKRAMAALKQSNLIRTLHALKQPVLGICSGMQILFDWSQEDDVKGLSILKGTVEKLMVPDNHSLPHMGWNTIAINQDAHGLLKNIPSQSYFYYVHSFGVKVGEHTLASTHYGPHFSAVVAKDNFYGVQFHPERSGAMGAQVLQNFLEL